MNNENFSHFHCSTEWHLTNHKGASLALAIHGLAYRVAGDSQVFYGSSPDLADYFRSDIKTVRKALRFLEKAKFFEVVRKVPGKPVAYRPINHKDWQAKHGGEAACIEKGLCVEYAKMDWQEDKLGLLLHGISGGEYKPFTNFIAGMRKTGHSDDAIATHWRAFLEIEKPTRAAHWRHGITKRFMAYLREQPVKHEPAKRAQLAGRQGTTSAPPTKPVTALSAKAPAKPVVREWGSGIEQFLDT